MTIVDLLEKNSREIGAKTALVEINPEMKDNRRLTWREYGLVQPTGRSYYRREISWTVFNEKANRFAHALAERNIGKGDKVAILLMNCLEWLPIYFGILKAGCIAVPLNYRYSSGEIEYCLDLADVDVLIFGPEFTDRLVAIKPFIDEELRFVFFVGCEK